MEKCKHLLSLKAGQPEYDRAGGESQKGGKGEKGKGGKGEWE
jgi:hypothetical protein